MNRASKAPSTASALHTGMRNIGFIGLGLIGIAVGLSDVVARVPANAVEVGPPLLSPSSQFPFGTDILGRDMASETLHALAVTATTAAFGALITVVVGGLLGFVVARISWGIGLALRWLAGILGAVPVLLLGILFIGLADRNLAPLAAGLAAAPLAFARSFDRAREVNQSRHAEFARATGISGGALLRRDLVYEFRDMFFVNVTHALAVVATILATVSFLGFGAVPPHRDLGSMIGAARETYFQAWWTAAFPALALVALVLCARFVSATEEGP